MSTRVFWAEEFKLFEKEFRNRQAGVELGYNTREYQSVSTGLEFGRTSIPITCCGRDQPATS